VKCNIQSGDLVNFYSTFASFQRGYVKRNPGIVLRVDQVINQEPQRFSAMVLWSDSSITNEHSTYLKKV